MAGIGLPCDKCGAETLVGPDMEGSRRGRTITLSWDCDGCGVITETVVPTLIEETLSGCGVTVVELFTGDELLDIARFICELGACDDLVDAALND